MLPEAIRKGREVREESKGGSWGSQVRDLTNPEPLLSLLLVFSLTVNS